MTEPSTIHSRIKDLRMRVSGYRGQKRFAEKTNINQKTLSRYEKDTKPTAPALGKMVKITHCNPFWLLTGEGQMFDPNAYQFTPRTDGGGGLPNGTVMCFGTVKCGEYPPPAEGTAYPQDIGVDYRHPGHYALIAEGESMAPTIRPGDLLILERVTGEEVVVPDGGIVEASVQTSEISFNTVKRLYQNEVYVELRPEVPDERDSERRGIVLVRTSKKGRFKNRAGAEVKFTIEGVLRGLHRRF
ncbi:MAG: helix-turn-helix domain-containing protein [Planctomycetes bacterium]|nr:helix-turn-helix domain-containing protein [Planctomycetota bacterium]